MPKLEVNGLKLHYHTHGKGLPIVFIHPPLLSSSIFRYQEVQLADTFRVITFDIRGHGHSDPSTVPVTYPVIVEDMIQLLNELDIPKAVVCGYSTGGGVALEALLTHPDRFHAGILIGGMSEVSDWRLMAEIKAASTLTYAGAKRLMAWAISTGNADMPITFGNLYRSSMEGNVANWHQYYHASLEFNCTSQLPKIHHPMLLINGEKDKRLARYAAILREKLPNVEQALVRGLKHQIPTKAAARMNGLVQHWIGLKLSDEMEEANERKKHKIRNIPKEDTVRVAKTHPDETPEERGARLDRELMGYDPQADNASADIESTVRH
ncbi:alpha/beta fold hydrolase [Paenibacillus turpanensis]|uniref:alpha/beta fold hydrolase n=1 Tax=Paenibacillus turpanensis TaxID=2689078 RepID=UPI00140996EE|nr:alpha/beta hydrolase [Paenibacillus turpanensis]